MGYYVITCPTLPEDTLQAASLLYGKGNIYLRLGDHLDELPVRLIPLDIKPCTINNRTLETSLQYAMLTIFQFVEELSDKQMIEAVRNRMDLKYALHLPLNAPGIEANSLCDFRKQLLSDATSQQVFQNLLDRLEEFSLFKQSPERPVTARKLLNTVCALTQFDEIVEAMYQVLEALTFANPDWLRQVMLPHWYDRYNRKRRFPMIPFSDEKWNARSLQIASDIQYLLQEIDRSADLDLASLREVRLIRRMWEERFIACAEEATQRQFIEWRYTNCAYCGLHDPREA